MKRIIKIGLVIMLLMYGAIMALVLTGKPIPDVVSYGLYVSIGITVFASWVIAIQKRKDRTDTSRLNEKRE
ncbi:MAG: hypothetical protein LBO70_01945 [Clostridiales Family XIII bacterium]|jgi:hypothetical protein|nr:hypothetical protein [Clostridiales Family XIII bacterium]